MTIYIKTLAKVASIDWVDNQPQAAATALIDDLEIFIPMANLIDKDAELTRLTKEINKLQADIEKSQTKLNNPNYIEKAPSHVVEQEKLRANEMQSSLNKLKERFQVISAVP
jgi:valyl-tRNA synthetase